MGFFAFLAGLGSVAGALILVAGLSASKSAPQEAAIAGLAIAAAVIPYVLFRAVQILHARSASSTLQAQLIERLSAIENALAAANQVRSGREQTRPTSPTIQTTASSTSEAPMAARVVRSGPIDDTLWTYEEHEDGTVRVANPQGVDLKYSSMAVARQELKWWK